MLSLLLSFILYGHTMNAIQTVGLSLSLIAMIANFYEKVNRTFSQIHAYVRYLLYDMEAKFL